MRGLIDRGKGSLTLTLQACEHTERSCRDQAQAIRGLKQQFDELAWEFALSFIIGEVVAAFLAAPTAGGSEAAANTAEAAEAGGITARAMELLRTFIGAVAARMKTVGSAIKDSVRALNIFDREASSVAAKAVQAEAKLPNAVPSGWVPRVADNGQGIVFQDPNATGNANMIRVMDPTPQYPNGYIRVYNSHGQPVDVNGRPGPKSATHIPVGYNGPWSWWP